MSVLDQQKENKEAAALAKAEAICVKWPATKIQNACVKVGGGSYWNTIHLHCPISSGGSLLALKGVSNSYPPYARDIYRQSRLSLALARAFQALHGQWRSSLASQILTCHITV